MFKIIVAFDENKTIGYEGWMPWNLPEDLIHFKNTTLNSKIIMGNTTFKGLKKPLADRETYVVSRHEVDAHETVKWIQDLDAFIAKYKDSDDVFYVCGGATIYKQFIDYCDEMIVSLVDGTHPSDTVFPDFDEDDFTMTPLKKYNGFTVISYKRK